MTLIVGLTSTGVGIRYDLTTLDDIIVGRDSLVVSTNDAAIEGVGSNHDVTVAGTVFGATYGVRLGNSRIEDTNQAVTIRPGGSVGSTTEFGTVGVYMNGTNSNILNEGTISAYNGIAIGGIDGETIGLSTISNLGTIYGADDAITRFSSDTESVLIHNSGVIQGLVLAFNDNGSTAIEIIRNRGEIVGNLSMGTLEDIVDNRGGSVEGEIDLGAGDDTFDNRGGFVSGDILGGDGNDVFRTNISAEEVLFGGAGTADLLDFRNDGGVILALDGAFENAGVALGDTYVDMENVFGSLTAADNIRGNGSANYLFSGGGNDVLDGAGGADILRGGNGRDTVTGGDGNDSFRFMSVAEAGDVMNDFSSAATGNNDRFQISAAGFGGGLTLGTLVATRFQTRTDNLAQDADDRFVFRTTDRTLWFDADGNGSRAAVMIADLQASATVTHLDILII